MKNEYDYTFNCASKTVKRLNKILNEGMNGEIRKKGKMTYYKIKIQLLKNINLIISNAWEVILNEER